MTAEKNNTVPACVGIIMDGNRRWAREKGLPVLEGHTKGYEKLKEAISWSQEEGVGDLIFYAFSTENWNRTKKEIGYLMNLIKTALIEESLEDINKKNIRVRFIGQRNCFGEDIQQAMKNVEEKTAKNTHGAVAFALSYGGRPEIVNAVNELLKEKKESITEEDINKHLWTTGIPDPDIIIRTGGEMRLSNFLPWQSVYSELFFTKTYWPDFSKEEFLNILEQFSQRERRKGV